MTQAEKNRQVVIDETETIFNRKELGGVESFFTPDFADHSSNGDGDLASYKVECEAIVNAFPDLHVRLDEVIAQGDTVVKRFTATGTHRGEYFGIPASGGHVTVRGMYMYHVRDGKISEQWRILDSLSFMQQLGAIPQPAQAR